jgi:17beta-estradiol 17-dehydrogenase / very-long-chain 3-oxoacyl-CoA reductase
MAMDTVMVILSGLGLVSLLGATYRVVNFLTFHFVPTKRPLENYKRRTAVNKQGEEEGLAYALVTGASAGIGAGIAQELARQGFGVVLLGHVPHELESMARKLETLVPSTAKPSAEPRFKVVVCDARTATPEQLASIVQSISHLRITILVNNIGGVPIVLPALRAFGTFSQADVDAVMNMNARFMARLTALMIPLLSSADGRGPSQRSLIISLSSGAWVGIPWVVMYGATKAFNMALSNGLNREFRAFPETRHIDALCITPGDVLTQGNNVGVDKNALTGDDYGKLIVQKTDCAVRRGMSVMVPHWLHEIQLSLVTMLPNSLVTPGMEDLMRKKSVAYAKAAAKKD